MNIDIRKGTYNKTISKDGIIHIVDTEKEYTYYEVELFNRYYDIQNREELKQRIKKDLEDIIKALDKEKEEEKER